MYFEVLLEIVMLFSSNYIPLYVNPERFKFGSMTHALNYVPYIIKNGLIHEKIINVIYSGKYYFNKEFSNNYIKYVFIPNTNNI